MVFTAGLTACYTARCVWLVFYGEERSHLHAHDAGPAMKVSLITLAVGTLTTWLLAGPFGTLMHSTLPFHEIHAASTMEVIMEVVTAPATLIALAVVALGIVAFWQRQALSGITKNLKWFNAIALNSYGFEAINRFIVGLTNSLGEVMRITQTGVLNWNVFGIIAGLVIVLTVLAMGVN